ncbi:MAG: 3'(2'),5'-bisphosphate nucleotidase CysQ [Flavobacteriales bacterium]|nr:3'(2'),5'-bisphosphate nucleotidase CysQ [Flavobacteriales bacterium]
MKSEELGQWMSAAVNAAIAGGAEILDVYGKDFDVEIKSDNSPLTIADRRAHLKIMELLEVTGLQVLSEEGREMKFEERKDWAHFWMVDPLDGTKEFVKRNGEFTVNIALIHNGQSIAGVIYVPVKKWLYVAMPEMGSYKVENVEPSQRMKISEVREKGSKLPQEKSGPFVVVGSRSHMSPETEEFIDKIKQEHGEVEIASMGSSLKICLVAEGAADVYPRFAPTMEWDTAAGHAIAKCAGKNIQDHTTGAEMKYNKENLLNNWFIVQ